MGTSNMKNKIAVIDIDGTLSIPTDRGYYDWHKVDQDIVIEPTVRFINSLKDDHIILILTGRNMGFPNRKVYGEWDYELIGLKKTLDWLGANNIFHDYIIMKETGSYEKSSEFKVRILQDILTRGVIADSSGFVSPKIDNIELSIAFDDNDSVVKALREAFNIPVFQVMA